ncbi:hypothetical protein BESB_029090 [Besnoitia besnoiti]|uniref:WD domain, G-beta repeat-containing protein n=1 Tax=Besnoitia besnoiti TaxID=94643 RepID=A0A2A9M2N1_BESBE|nr:uncharacterized protein BESB_029090 [Besnoitia besnoiti]PFH31474.1 hypothetical protein BESB_029090 [Besnoitia besnoiti]
MPAAIRPPHAEPRTGDADGEASVLSGSRPSFSPSRKSAPPSEPSFSDVALQGETTSKDSLQSAFLAFRPGPFTGERDTRHGPGRLDAEGGEGSPFASFHSEPASSLPWSFAREASMEEGDLLPLTLLSSISPPSRFARSASSSTPPSSSASSRDLPRRLGGRDSRGLDLQLLGVGGACAEEPGEPQRQGAQLPARKAPWLCDVDTVENSLTEELHRVRCCVAAGERADRVFAAPRTPPCLEADFASDEEEEEASSFLFTGLRDPASWADPALPRAAFGSRRGTESRRESGEARQRERPVQSGTCADARFKNFGSPLSGAAPRLAFLSAVFGGRGTGRMHLSESAKSRRSHSACIDTATWQQRDTQSWTDASLRSAAPGDFRSRTEELRALTRMAYRRFGVSRLWPSKPRRNLDLPDSVLHPFPSFPMDWSAKKGFFATALLSRLYIANTDNTCAPEGGAICLWDAAEPRGVRDFLGGHSLPGASLSASSEWPSSRSASPSSSQPAQRHGELFFASAEGRHASSPPRHSARASQRTAGEPATEQDGGAAGRTSTLSSTGRESPFHLFSSSQDFAFLSQTSSASPALRASSRSLFCPSPARQGTGYPGNSARSSSVPCASPCGCCLGASAPFVASPPLLLPAPPRTEDSGVPAEDTWRESEEGRASQTQSVFVSPGVFPSARASADHQDGGERLSASLPSPLSAALLHSLSALAPNPLPSPTGASPSSLPAPPSSPLSDMNSVALPPPVGDGPSLFCASLLPPPSSFPAPATGSRPSSSAYAPAPAAPASASSSSAPRLPAARPPPLSLWPSEASLSVALLSAPASSAPSASASAPVPPLAASPLVTAVRFCRTEELLLAVGFESGEVEIWAPFPAVDSCVAARPSRMTRPVCASRSATSDPRLFRVGVSSLCHSRRRAATRRQNGEKTADARAQSPGRDDRTRALSEVDSVHAGAEGDVVCASRGRLQSYEAERRGLPSARTKPAPSSRAFSDAPQLRSDTEASQPSSALPCLLSTSHLFSGASSRPQTDARLQTRAAAPSAPCAEPQQPQATEEGSPVVSLAWHPSRLLLASGHASGVVVLWRFARNTGSDPNEARKGEGRKRTRATREAGDVRGFAALEEAAGPRARAELAGIEEAERLEFFEKHLPRGSSSDAEILTNVQMVRVHIFRVDLLASSAPLSSPFPFSSAALLASTALVSSSCFQPSAAAAFSRRARAAPEGASSRTCREQRPLPLLREWGEEAVAAAVGERESEREREDRFTEWPVRLAWDAAGESLAVGGSRGTLIFFSLSHLLQYFREVDRLTDRLRRHLGDLRSSFALSEQRCARPAPAILASPAAVPPLTTGAAVEEAPFQKRLRQGAFRFAAAASLYGAAYCAEEARSGREGLCFEGIVETHADGERETAHVTRPLCSIVSPSARAETAALPTLLVSSSATNTNRSSPFFSGPCAAPCAEVGQAAPLPPSGALMEAIKSAQVVCGELQRLQRARANLKAASVADASEGLKAGEAPSPAFPPSPLATVSNVSTRTGSSPPDTPLGLLTGRAAADQETAARPVGAAEARAKKVDHVDEAAAAASASPAQAACETNGLSAAETTEEPGGKQTAWPAGGGDASKGRNETPCQAPRPPREVESAAPNSCRANDSVVFQDENICNAPRLLRRVGASHELRRSALEEESEARPRGGVSNVAISSPKFESGETPRQASSLSECPWQARVSPPALPAPSEHNEPAASESGPPQHLWRAFQKEEDARRRAFSAQVESLLSRFRRAKERLLASFLPERAPGQGTCLKPDLLVACAVEKRALRPPRDGRPGCNPPEAESHADRVAGQRFCRELLGIKNVLSHAHGGGVTALEWCEHDAAVIVSAGEEFDEALVPEAPRLGADRREEGHDAETGRQPAKNTQAARRGEERRPAGSTVALWRVSEGHRSGPERLFTIRLEGLVTSFLWSRLTGELLMSHASCARPWAPSLSSYSLPAPSSASSASSSGSSSAHAEGSPSSTSASTSPLAFSFASAAEAVPSFRRELASSRSRRRMPFSPPFFSQQRRGDEATAERRGEPSSVEVLGAREGREDAWKKGSSRGRWGVTVWRYVNEESFAALASSSAAFLEHELPAPLAAFGRQAIRPKRAPRESSRPAFRLPALVKVGELGTPPCLKTRPPASPPSWLAEPASRNAGFFLHSQDTLLFTSSRQTEGDVAEEAHAQADPPAEPGVEPSESRGSRSAAAAPTTRPASLAQPSSSLLLASASPRPSVALPAPAPAEPERVGRRPPRLAEVGDGLPGTEARDRRTPRGPLPTAGPLSPTGSLPGGPFASEWDAFLAARDAGVESSVYLEADNASCLIQSADGSVIAYWSLPTELITVWELPAPQAPDPARTLNRPRAVEEPGAALDSDEGDPDDAGAWALGGDDDSRGGFLLGRSRHAGRSGGQRAKREKEGNATRVSSGSCIAARPAARRPVAESVRWGEDLSVAWLRRASQAGRRRDTLLHAERQTPETEEGHLRCCRKSAYEPEDAREARSESRSGLGPLFRKNLLSRSVQSRQAFSLPGWTQRTQKDEGKIESALQPGRFRHCAEDVQDEDHEQEDEGHVSDFFRLGAKTASRALAAMR